METGKPSFSFSRNQFLAAVLVGLLVLFIGGYFVALWNENVKIDNLARINSVSYAGDSPRIIKGKVSFLNLDPIEKKGDTVIIVRTASGQEHEVRVSPRGSLCDQAAVAIPQNLPKNDMVEVNGTRGSSKTLVVCQKGTYVKSF